MPAMSTQFGHAEDWLDLPPLFDVGDHAPVADEKMLADIETDVVRPILTRYLDAIESPELDYRDFIRAAWPVIEPGKEIVWGWHLDAICDHLQAVTERKIKKLLICIPPRFSKSTLVSVLWPAWVWTWRPQEQFLFASYDAALSSEHALKSRDLIISDWYQQRWGGQFGISLNRAMQKKSHFSNSRQGCRISTSVEGGATGKGGDILVLDDPHNLAEIRSEAHRNKVYHFYESAWRNRKNDPKLSAEVCIMQRAHDEDIAGTLMEQFGYKDDALILPNEYDPKRSTVTSIGFKDPRKEAGELLCPARFGPEEVTDMRRSERSYECQYNQQPQPDDGIIFKREWFRYLDAAPTNRTGCIIIVRSWDTAATDPTLPKASSDPDWTVGVKMSRWEDGRIIVEDIVRGRWTPHVVDTTIRATARLDTRTCRIWEEEEGGASGKAVTEQRRKVLIGYTYKAQHKTGAKHVWWEPFAAQAEGLNVWLVRGEWNTAFLSELTALPNARHDDQADAASLACYAVAMARRKIRTTSYR